VNASLGVTVSRSACDCKKEHRRLTLKTCGKHPVETACEGCGQEHSRTVDPDERSGCGHCSRVCGNQRYCEPCAIIKDLCVCGAELPEKYMLLMRPGVITIGL
jgi:hypothetical protein